MSNSIRRTAVRLSAAVVFSLSAAACAHAPPPEPEMGPEPLVLLPGDMVRLRVWRGDDINGDYLVNNDGTVVFPIIGPWSVTGKSADSLKAELVTEYGKYLRTPSIEVLPLRRVAITGAVQRGGIHALDPTMTLADALALAGGATLQGDPNKVDLIRDGRVIRAEIRQDVRILDLPIRSGDQLFVPERSWISRNAGVVASIISTTGALMVALISYFRDKN